MTWTHDGLLADLASHLRSGDRMVWCDMQLGPSGSPRPDVFTLQKSYSRPSPAAYEIKISRSDFRSDTTSGKWQAYLKFAGSVTFAVPDGLVTLADVPDGCGLIVRKDAVWRYVRRPTLQAVQMPFSACMKLLIDGVSRVSHPELPRARSVELWREHASVRRKFGEGVAIAARDLAAAHQRIADLNGYADREYDRARVGIEARTAVLTQQAKAAAGECETAKRELCAYLGLHETASVYSVRSAIATLKTRCNADARVQAAEAQLARARSAIDSATRCIALPPEERAA